MSRAAAHRVAKVITQHRFTFRAELGLQDAIATVLTDAGMVVEREVALTAQDRIDMLVDLTVGVEVKVGSSTTNVMRQLQRYAASDQVDALLLVTTRVTHRYLPDEVAGKPLTVVVLGGAL